RAALAPLRLLAGRAARAEVARGGEREAARPRRPERLDRRARRARQAAHLGRAVEVRLPRADGGEEPALPRRRRRRPRPPGAREGPPSALAVSNDPAAP